MPNKDLLTAVPMATLTTPDGYTPPTLSQDLVKGVPFDRAVCVGKQYTDRFARWDKMEVGKKNLPRPEQLNLLRLGFLHLHNQIRAGKNLRV